MVRERTEPTGRQGRKERASASPCVRSQPRATQEVCFRSQPLVKVVPEGPPARLSPWRADATPQSIGGSAAESSGRGFHVAA